MSSGSVAASAARTGVRMEEPRLGWRERCHLCHAGVERETSKLEAKWPDCAQWWR